MNKVAWFLLLQIGLTALIPRADLSQLGLISNLYTHFSVYHASENYPSKVMAFLGFITKHYGANQHEHQDEDEHDQLPFKDFTSSVFFLLIQQDGITPPDPYDHELHESINTNQYPVGFSSSIDHPPSI